MDSIEKNINTDARGFSPEQIEFRHHLVGGATLWLHALAEKIRESRLQRMRDQMLRGEVPLELLEEV